MQINKINIFFSIFIALVSALSAEAQKATLQKQNRLQQQVRAQNSESNRVQMSESSRIQRSNLDPSPSRIQPLVYLGSGVYSEKNESQEIELRRPENYSFGVRYGKWASFFESSQFEEVTGQGNFSVERKRKSYLLWINYDVASLDKWLYLPIGAGAGVYNETSIVKVGSLEDRVNGDYQWNSGLSAGLEARYKFLTLKTEAQVLFANNQTPNPTWAAFARLGFILF